MALKIVDANILLYAYDSASARHAAAARWLAAALSGPELVGLPWQCMTAFLRITTSSRYPGRGMSAAEAVEVAGSWIARPNARIVTPGEQHWPVFKRLIEEGQVSGPLMMDAHLAALAIECGAVLCTTDRDFARFPELKWMDPLDRRS